MAQYAQIHLLRHRRSHRLCPGSRRWWGRGDCTVGLGFAFFGRRGLVRIRGSINDGWRFINGGRLDGSIQERDWTQVQSRWLAVRDGGGDAEAGKAGLTAAAAGGTSASALGHLSQCSCFCVAHLHELLAETPRGLTKHGLCLEVLLMPLPDTCNNNCGGAWLCSKHTSTTRNL